MKKSLRNKLVIMVLLIMLAVFYIPDHQYESKEIQEIDYENDNIRCFNYSLGHIYIGSLSAIEELKNQVLENDILIIDYRGNIDPDMQVLDSYKMWNIDTINEVLEIMQFYEESDPSMWNRSLSSMRNEWEMHNYSYIFNHDKDRTRDVDLNNDDEEKYDSEILRKLLRN